MSEQERSAAGRSTESSTRYAIRISGHLDQRWSSRLAEMAIVHLADGTSELRGPLADQAALHGVLAGLRDLGIPIVSVQRLEPGDGSSEEQPG